MSTSLVQDVQLHGPFRCNSKNIFRSVDGETLKRTCVDFTLLWYFQIEPKLSEHRHLFHTLMWTSTLGLLPSPRGRKS